MTDTPKRIWIDSIRHTEGYRVLAGVDHPGEKPQVTYLREDIARAVRPLEWDGIGAVCLGGLRYLAYRQTSGLWSVALKSAGRGGHDLIASDCPTEDAARAAAQADYEQRILSALMPVEGE